MCTGAVESPQELEEGTDRQGGRAGKAKHAGTSDCPAPKSGTRGTGPGTTPRRLEQQPQEEAYYYKLAPERRLWILAVSSGEPTGEVEVAELLQQPGKQVLSG